MTDWLIWTAALFALVYALHRAMGRVASRRLEANMLLREMGRSLGALVNERRERVITTSENWPHGQCSAINC